VGVKESRADGAGRVLREEDSVQLSQFTGCPVSKTNAVAIDILNQLRDLRNNTLFNGKDNWKGIELFFRGQSGGCKEGIWTAALDIIKTSVPPGIQRSNRAGRGSEVCILHLSELSYRVCAHSVDAVRITAARNSPLRREEDEEDQEN